MTTTIENLRTYALADAAISALIGARLWHSQVPKNPTLPFGWIRRRSIDDLDLMSDDGMPPFYESFDLELVAETPGQAATLAAAFRARLHNHKGTMGDAVYNGVRVADQSDDYVARNADANDQLTIESLDIEVTNV